MKKSLFIAILLLTFSLLTGEAKAQEATSTPDVAPIVSIGIGNGNSPENTGPTHMGVFHGLVPVFATVTDDDLLGYHFRIVKDGGIDGYTCLEELALYAEENQGYASTTLSKEACGFNFNQSVFIAESFINQIIATLSTMDLGAFSGDGDYWFILGANDNSGNRTHENYLLDPRVMITVDNTPPVTYGSVAVTSINGPFTIDTTSTDTHGVASTTLLSATSDGVTCSAFSPIVTLDGSMGVTSTSTYSWMPESTGTYCLSLYSTDTLGNVEMEKTIATGVNFEKLPEPEVVPPSPEPTPTPAPASGGGGGGGNGPIAGSFGAQNVSGATFSFNPPSPSPSTGPSTESNTSNSNSGQGSVSGNSNNQTGNNIALSTAGSDNGPVSSVTVVSSDENSIEVVSEEEVEEQNQLAAAVLSGFNLNWLWLLLALAIVLGYYLYNKKA